MILIRSMDASQVERIAEIDRSERVTIQYQMQAGQLQALPVDWQVSRWSLEGAGGHSVARRIEKLCQMLADGATMLGAFDTEAPAGEALAGFALLRYNLRPGIAELAALFVSRAYRRQGVGALLCAEIERLARQAGARCLYVSATPSGSAVGFYRSQGFEPVAEPLPEMFELEPEDIHMQKNLNLR